MKIKKLGESNSSEYPVQLIYSPDGRLIKRITKSRLSGQIFYPADTVVDYEYNENNNLSRIVYSPTEYSTLLYDNDGNIIRADFYNDDTHSNSWKYVYNKKKLIEIQNEDNFITFTYDMSGNVMTKQNILKGEKSIKSLSGL